MMELYILNEWFQETVSIVDGYKSLIWTKRYTEFGECELYIQASEKTLDLFRVGRFLVRNDDDMLCRIDSVELQTDAEEGDYLVVTAKDCRSFLSQRIVWEQTNFTGTVEDYIRKLVNDAIIHPTLGSRMMGYFFLGARVGLPDTITQQVTYDNLGEKIIELCNTYGYGTRARFYWNAGYPDRVNLIRLEVYQGVDRSYAQNVNDFVVFSPDFDNIKTSRYLVDSRDVKTVALVGGEGEGSDRVRVEYGGGSEINRYEMFVDASGVSSEPEEGGQPIDYEEVLRNQGKEALSEHKTNIIFDGEVEPDYSYKYRIDYDLGDTVQVRNEYGIEARARIIEVIESFDENGYSLIPAFEYMEV